MSVQPIPDGFHSVTPYLIVKKAADAIEFYKQALGAEERMRLTGPDGVSVMHAELTIGDSVVMLADENPDMGFLGPESLGGTATGLCIYLEDVDSAFQRALEAGGTELRPLVDQFYGDRSGTFQDPYGHWWTLATHTEDLTPEEIDRRFQEMMQGGGDGPDSAC